MSGFSNRLRAGTMLGRGLFNHSASAGPRRLLVIGGVGVPWTRHGRHHRDVRPQDRNPVAHGSDALDQLTSRWSSEHAGAGQAGVADQPGAGRECGRFWSILHAADQRQSGDKPSGADRAARRTTGEDCGEPSSGVPLRQCGSAPDVGYPDGPLCATADDPPGRGHSGRSQSGAYVLRRDQPDASRLGWPVPSDHRRSRGEVRRGTGQRGSNIGHTPHPVFGCRSRSSSIECGHGHHAGWPRGLCAHRSGGEFGYRRSNRAAGRTLARSPATA